MTEYGFTAEDGKAVHALKWPIEKPRAVVQIIHGMAEHIARYDEFARYLNSRGFVVAGEDHRGHGKTAGTVENTGYFADSDGWDKVVGDNVRLGKRLREEYPGIPFYLFGHSMGSFISRKLVAEFPEGIDRVILSGSGDFSASQITMLSLIAKIQKFFLGGKARAKMLDKLSFSAMNDNFKPGRTGFEWLSRDEAKVDEYLADPYCGFVATLGMYIDFAAGISYLAGDEHLHKTPKDLPVLFYSGDEDPVGGNTVLIRGVFDKYVQTGHTKAELVFNRNGRHESINETNRIDVYRILADWLDEVKIPENHTAQKDAAN